MKIKLFYFFPIGWLRRSLHALKDKAKGDAWRAAMTHAAYGSSAQWRGGKLVVARLLAKPSKCDSREVLKQRPRR